MLTKETPYFSHDSNTSEDPKIVRAEKLFGDMAYVWFFKTLEILRQQRDLKLLLIDVDILHTKVKCPSPELYRSFILTSKLFSYDDFYFWSNSLIARVGNSILASYKKSKAANIRWGNFYKLHGNNEKALEYFSAAEIIETQSAISNPILLPINNSDNNIPESDNNIITINDSNIILPKVPFIITRNAELSWKTCLLICSKSYDEIKKLFPNITEDVFLSYKMFNENIDNDNNEVDLRTIRTSNIQIDLPSYSRLYNKYPKRSVIQKALIKMVNTGIKPEHVVYNRLEQFIGYIQTDDKPQQNISSINGKHVKQLIEGYYYEDGKKILSIDVNDFNQCKQLLKINKGIDADDNYINNIKSEKGEKEFIKWIQM